MEKKETPQMRYDRKHTTRCYLKFNNAYDKDILDKLDGVPNKQGYIKECIRHCMEEEKPTLRKTIVGDMVEIEVEIPAWMDALAMAEKLDLSAILCKALMEKLGVDENGNKIK